MKIARALVAGVLLAAAVGCQDRPDTGDERVPVKAGAEVGVVLPDSSTRQRFGSDDPRFLRAAFRTAGLNADIQYAENDPARFRRIAESLIDGGVKVLVTVNIDADSSRAIIGKAKAKGVATIDYDRLTLNGGADYYVSFDNVQVGRLQGEALVRCIAEKRQAKPLVAELNGAGTDYNAEQFKIGYDAVLQERYDDASYLKGPDQWVPEWSTDEASALFEQMLSQQPRITAVLAANDGIANAVITILRKHGKAKSVPVTGQDATVEGLRNVLTGDQCMTVYKPISAEAQAVADLATALIQKREVRITDRIKDPVSGAYVSAILQSPVGITRGNIDILISDGFVERETLCTTAYREACVSAGLLEHAARAR